MDNLCHTLVGAAMGEAGLKRQSRYGNAALMLSANAPDIDVLVFFTDTASVSFRRGWTHGIAAQLVLPVVVTATLWTLDRVRPARGDAPPLRAGWLLLLSFAGVYSHVFLDYLNNYGVRLLTPFDWRWFYGDAVFIIDPWLWVALGLGVWLSRRRLATRPARWALGVSAAYIVAMILSASAARTIVTDAWRAAHDTPPRALMVGPRPLTPLTRDVIVDAGDRYDTGTFEWRTRAVRWESMAVVKNDDLPAVAAARHDRAIQQFLVWSRFPFWQIEETRDGTRVTVRDVRFIGTGRGFAATATVR
jgi:inner membrane protein